VGFNEEWIEIDLGKEFDVSVLIKWEDGESEWIKRARAINSLLNELPNISWED